MSGELRIERTSLRRVQRERRLNPLVLNALPVTLTCETVNAAVPVLLSWMVWESVVPTVTLTKLKLDGVMLNAACTPVP